jgi:hypothetical protein
MVTYEETLELMRQIIENAQKAPAIYQMVKLAKEANMSTHIFMATLSERNKSKLNNKQVDIDDDGEHVSGISYSRFTKHSPRWWLSKMKDSAWMKEGCPGLESKDDAIMNINGEDEIPGFPPMRDCKWSELGKRSNFLIILIKRFNDYNDSHGIRY